MTDDYLDSVEAFPGAINAIRDALNQADPTDSLVEIVRAHPELSTITDIVVIYFEVVEHSPSQVNKVAAALVNLRNSIGIRILTYGAVQVSIAFALDWQLCDLLKSELVYNSEPITPSNNLLIASLLSAVATKNSICPSEALSFALHHGLYYDCQSVETHQVLVLGACLQLSMSGSYFCGPYGLGHSQVFCALERIKTVGVVKHPGGQQLLAVTIQQAKNGFKSDIDDGWSILFPQ